MVGFFNLNVNQGTWQSDGLSIFYPPAKGRWIIVVDELPAALYGVPAEAKKPKMSSGLLFRPII